MTAYRRGEPGEAPAADTGQRRDDVGMAGGIPLEPVIALVAGILILLMPKLLNYVVAIYLIVTGAVGLLRVI